jgi:2-polyprenyl-3-methyl-5-hydroxy-6-metoxy-1,4-benzoquinol methylase
MRETVFREHSRTHVYFYGSLPTEMLGFMKNLKNFSLIDLGCGDCGLIYSLYQNRLLKNSREVVGLDIAKERVSRFKTFVPFVKGIVGDVQNLKQIKSNSFDVAISSQVIEHIPDEEKMLKEVYRILKPNCYFYVSTVIKKWYGFWIYWKNGFKLDPTHIREYKNAEEFLNLVENSGFNIIKWGSQDVSYPILDLIVRLLIRVNLVRPSPDFYLKHKTVSNFRDKIKLKIIGYKTIEVLGVKQ